MRSFSIAVKTPADVIVLVPPGLEVLPDRWSFVAKGGCWDANITFTGNLAEMSGLTSWLGYTLEIINENGTPVWWGDVQSVEISSGGVRRGISLQNLANRISVRYSQKQAGGAVASADTPWTDETFSTAAYGVWERRITPDRPMTSNEATAYAATALMNLSKPSYSLVPDQGETSAIVYCTGYWQRTRRLYHSEGRGLEENTSSGKAYPLGLGIVGSTLVAFSNPSKAIWQEIAAFKNFTYSDVPIKVTGAAMVGNNQVYTVTGVDDREAVTYTSNAVTFSPNDDVADANEGLAFLENDDVFRISGTVSNNGTHRMKKSGSGVTEVSPGFHGGNIVSETPASTVFNRGNCITVTPTPANEVMGSSVTVTSYGQRYYQAFAPQTSGIWTVDSIELRLKRIGGPVDGVVLQLVNDNAGSPGTLIESVTVAADDIPLEMGWVSFNFSNVNTITSSSVYGLVVLRSGANDWDDFYEIDLDDEITYDAAKPTKAFDGAAYQVLSPNVNMAFRVLGGIDTGQQIANILTSLGWVLAADTPTTSVVSNQHRDDELKAYDELESLLDGGTSLGYRIVARTTRNFGVVVTAKPDKTTVRWALRDGNVLVDLFGRDAEPGISPAGEWVKLGDASTLGPWAALSPAFIERAEYTASSGEWQLEPEQAVDIYDSGVQQG